MVVCSIKGVLCLGSLYSLAVWNVLEHQILGSSSGVVFLGQCC